MNQNKLPTLAQIYEESGSLDKAFQADQLNHILSQSPPDTWVKRHPFAKDVRYIPIEKVEYLLKRIFKRYRIEVINYSQLFNSVSCHVRVHYVNPTNGEWDYQDGVGAVGVQVDKGAQASDLTSIKQDAVMKALPAAKSYAIKDACENLGAVFGANLNRKDVVEFEPDKEIVSREEQRKQKLLANGINVQ
jgi:hypothetical protein